jgi:hypothetical protein
MFTFRRTLAALVAVTGLVAVPAAQASPPVTVTTGLPATWTSAAGSGLNTTFFTDSLVHKGQCGADAYNLCDDTLVHVTADQVVEGTTMKFRIDGFSQTSDFDLRVYESDAAGAAGTYSGSPTGDAAANDIAAGTPAAGNDPRATAAGDPETKVIDVTGLVDDTGALDAYFLVRIPYFTVANDSYTGHATLVPPAAG